MRKTAPVLCVVLLALVALPATAAERKSGAGFGFTSGTGEPEDGAELDFVGFTVFGKIGFTENWGLLLSLRDMEDDEDFVLEEDDYTQFGVHAVYMWRHGKIVRPHVKFGLARTDLEVSAGPLSVDDDSVGISVGGGLEAGSDRIAFFGDFDSTVVELFDEDFTFTNVTLGVIFKF